jgi:hypothetical protein
MNKFEKLYKLVVILGVAGIVAHAQFVACKSSAQPPPATPEQVIATTKASLKALDSLLSLIQQAERDRPGAVLVDVDKSWEPIWTAYLAAVELETATEIIIVDVGNGGASEAGRSLRAASCGVGRLLTLHDSKLAGLGALLCF